MKGLDWTSLEKARSDDSFGFESCLTIYLENLPDDFAGIAARLSLLNATNLDGSEDGFVYAKVPVSLEQSDIEEKIAQVRAIVAGTSTVISVIDLDSTPDWRRSKFYPLWTIALCPIAPTSIPS